MYTSRRGYTSQWWALESWRAKPLNHLNQLPRISLRIRVANAIRDAIIEGKFKPGEKIPEKDLAKELGVSRTPVREAIHILEQQRLVEIRPKHGTFIATLDWEEVQDSLSVRTALEQLAVQQAMERLDPKEWDELCAKFQDVLDRMLDAESREDVVRSTELDIEWHTLLIDAAGNECLSRTWRNAGLSTLVWSPEREIYPFNEPLLLRPAVRHKELLDVLRKREPDNCAEAIRSHIFVKLDDIRESLEAVSQEGAPITASDLS
jgi:DNA-binding GntR family transcriptional regulator